MPETISKKETENVLARYEKFFHNNIALVASARKGLKPEAVFDFIFLSQLSAALVEQLLSKTIKTFQNYIQNKTSLDPVVSEKLLKLFALYEKGVFVFGNADQFNKWLAEPSFGLGNQLPRHLLDTITGIELVAEELTRIEYGDLA